MVREVRCFLRGPGAPHAPPEGSLCWLMSQSQDSLHRSISGLDLAADMLYLPSPPLSTVSVQSATPFLGYQPWMARLLLTED